MLTYQGHPEIDASLNSELVAGMVDKGIISGDKEEILGLIQYDDKAVIAGTVLLEFLVS